PTTTGSVRSLPHGCANSSLTDRSRLEMLMSGRYGTCPQATLWDTDSATSSPASAAGALRSGSPAGPTTDLSGPAPAPASLSARQAAERGWLTSGTYGRPSTGSSSRDSLQSSLASRLMQRFASAGSTLFGMTWQASVTPSGWSICRLRASARRTSGSGCGGWRTPTAGHKAKGGAQCPEKRLAGGHTVDLQDQVRLASWPTPVANDDNATGRTVDGEKLDGWPTPMACQS